MIGAIIAGGPSTRFNGEPKGLHVVGGQRIIDRVAAALRSVASELLVVSSIEGASNWLPGVRVVPDLWLGRGSLVGIHAALRHSSEPVLAVAWDMPFVTADLLRLLCDRSARSQFATVPETSLGLQPLCAIYSPSCLPHIERALRTSELGITRMLEQLPEVERIDAADIEAIGDPNRLFFNVNTAEDLTSSEALIGQSSS